MVGREKRLDGVLGVWGALLGLGTGLDGEGAKLEGLELEPTERPEKSWEAKLACFSFSLGCCGVFIDFCA